MLESAWRHPEYRAPESQPPAALGNARLLVHGPSTQATAQPATVETPQHRLRYGLHES